MEGGQGQGKASRGSRGPRRAAWGWLAPKGTEESQRVLEHAYALGQEGWLLCGLALHGHWEMVETDGSKSRLSLIPAILPSPSDFIFLGLRDLNCKMGLKACTCQIPENMKGEHFIRRCPLMGT